jgi:hypothetical protein
MAENGPHMARNRPFDREGAAGAPARRFDSLAALMPDVFWIGFGIAAFGALLGLISGARSHSTRTLTGLAIGAFLGLMAAFPLLVIGLATS